MRKFPVKKLDYIIFFDVESSGPNPEIDQIIEIAAAVYDKEGNLIDQFDSLIKKPKDFVNKAKFVNNIEESELQALSDSYSKKKVLLKIINFFGKFSDSIVIAHNTEFDLLFLKNELDSVGINYSNIKFKDSLEIFRSTFRAKSYALDKLRFEFSIHSKGHRALVDCIDLATVFFKFKKKDLLDYVNLSYSRNLKFGLFDKLYYYCKSKKHLFSEKYFAPGKLVEFKYKGKKVSGTVIKSTNRLVELQVKSRNLIYLYDKIERYY